MITISTMKLLLTFSFLYLSTWVKGTELNPNYRYQGCAVVDLACFSNPIVFSDGTLTHEACSQACQGARYAALFPTACRCGNDTAAVVPTKDSFCDYPCMGDPSYGMCGSNCPGSSPNITNIVALPPIAAGLPAPISSPGDHTPSATMTSSVQVPSSPNSETSATSTRASFSTSDHHQNTNTEHETGRASPTVTSTSSDLTSAVPSPIPPNGDASSDPWTTPTLIPTSTGSTLSAFVGTLMLAIAALI